MESKWRYKIKQAEISVKRMSDEDELVKGIEGRQWWWGSESNTSLGMMHEWIATSR